MDAFAQAFSGHRTTSVRGVDVHVAEAGDGPPIVLLHGNPDTHAVWGPVVARLAPAHRCIAPDLPGFGGSRAPDGFDCSLDNQGAFVHDLLAALELPRVHLVVLRWYRAMDPEVHGEVTHLADCGHRVMLEEPERAAAAIAALVARS